MDEFEAPAPPSDPIVVGYRGHYIKISGEQWNEFCISYATFYTTGRKTRFDPVSFFEKKLIKIIFNARMDSLSKDGSIYHLLDPNSPILFVLIQDKLETKQKFFDLTVSTKEKRRKASTSTPITPSVTPFRDFQVEDPTLGILSVSPHAWERFIGRWQNSPPHNLNADEKTDYLIDCFLDAYTGTREVRMPKGFMVERIIRNSFKVAKYMYNEALDCRFVLVETEAFGKYEIATVERPIKKDWSYV